MKKLLILGAGTGDTIMANRLASDLTPPDWLAKEVGIDELTDRHQIHVIREGYEKDGKVPSLRAIKKAGGVPIQELYALFPDGPGKKSAYVAGLGKPEGCV